MLPVYYPAWTYSRLCLFTRNPIGKHVLKITLKNKVYQVHEFDYLLVTFLFITAKTNAMLDNLMDLVRKYTGSAVNSNPAIPNEKNEAVSQQAGHSIMDTLKNAINSGNITNVLGYFKKGGTDNDDIVKEATSNYAQDLESKHGLNAPQAKEVASRVVPQTMNEMAAKTIDPNDKSFNIQDIFNKLSGGKTSGFNMEKAMNKFTGGKFDKDGDGDLDLQDLKSLLTGGGSIADKVKGMFN